MMKANRSSRQRGVYKRGSKWCIRYSYKGKTVRETIGKYEYAVKAYHARKAQIAEGAFEQQYGFRVQKQKLPTFMEFADKFLEDYCDAPHRKVSLRRNYVNDLKALIPFFGTMRLDEITKWHVQKFRTERAKQIAKCTGKVISPKTVNRSLASLKRMFNVAKSWGLIKENPVLGIEMFPEKQTKLEYLMPEECRRLIDAADNYFKPILTMAIHTGMRKGEILGLKWNQGDLRNMLIRLDESKTVRTQLEYVPLGRTVCKILAKLERQGEYVFYMERGEGPLRDIRRPFRKALEKSGIAAERKRGGKSPLRFHDLRHTTTSNMAMVRIPLDVVQRQLRHKCITTTQRYAHLSPDYMREAIDILDNRFSTDTKTDTIAESPLYTDRKNTNNINENAGVAQG